MCYATKILFYPLPNRYLAYSCIHLHVYMHTSYTTTHTDPYILHVLLPRYRYSKLFIYYYIQLFLLKLHYLTSLQLVYFIYNYILYLSFIYSNYPTYFTILLYHTSLFLHTSDITTSISIFSPNYITITSKLSLKLLYM